jgi:3-methyl-2-oxobutanoate hydroxymethyltransferase
MITIRQLAQWKESGEKFTMLTAYDYTMAALVAKAGIPVALVGDSLGQVVLGYSSTLPVTMEDMIHHTRAVVRGAAGCLVVTDMPFMSYQVSVEDAVRNAGRLMKEGGAHAVKLEGGADMVPVIQAIVRADIPVMAHIGLCPQAVHQCGYRTQAVDAAGRKQLLADARAVEKAGAFAVVIEKTEHAAAREVTRVLKIPTIGCGSGPYCDGQVLVTYDVLGLFQDFTPCFVKRYAQLGDAAMTALTAFAADVRAGKFPEAKRGQGKQNKK